VEIVDDQAFQRFDVHPRAGQPQWIPRLGQGQQRLWPLLAKHGVTTTAAPLYYMDHNRELALFGPEETPRGLVLDPCTHFRQVPLAARSRAFTKLPFGRGGAFDPDRDHVTEAELLALAISCLECQRAFGATLLPCPYHLTGAPGSRGRELDLLLARLAAEHFRAQSIDEPAALAEQPVRRELYAVLALRRELLSSTHELIELAQRALALDADGFWVKIEGFDDRAPRSEISAGSGFLAELGADGRVVVSCGPGQLHLPLLVEGVSTSLGCSESERFSMPAAERRDFPKGRTRTAYHPKFLRSFAADADSAKRAFATCPCRCSRHPARRPPEGAELAEHCGVCRAREAHEVRQIEELVERREWLLASAAMASHLAHDAGVDFTPAAVLEAVFEGVDRVRSAEPGSAAHGA
jgi:hypothetical protein